MITQNRLKSPVFWGSLVAQLISLLAFLGVFEKLGIVPADIEQIVAMALQMLVLFGVLNNPTNKENF